MKTMSTYQEILLFTETGFASRDLANKQADAAKDPQTPRQKLIAACWNGVLNEWLPEIAEQQHDPYLRMLDVQDANYFLHVHYGGFGEFTSNEDSLNPYLFLDESLLN
jgi:hypothetical protein